MAQQDEVVRILNAEATQKALFVSLRPALVGVESWAPVLEVAKQRTCIV
jgi:hypothetical protein